MTSIRPMRMGDAPAIAALATQLGYPVSTTEVEGRIEPLLGHDDHLVLVATDEADAVIGWIHLYRQLSLQEPARAVIGGLVVNEGSRDAGVGAALVEAGESWALRLGLGSVLVRSRSTRTRAHRFYERIGYVETKRSHVFEKRFV
jgi:predicted N-acetyltransferase YhbS